MLHSVKTIFFDLDDTVWWFSHNSLLALRHIYDKHHLSDICHDYDRFFDVYHKHNSALWKQYAQGEIKKDLLVAERFRRTLDELGSHDGNETERAALLNEEYLAYLATLPTLVDGAREAITELRSRGFKIAVLSNGFAGVQQQKLRSAGVEQIIDHIVLSDDCGITKPQRGLFDYALKVTDSEPENTVMVGDDYLTDIDGAKRAGWRTVFYNPNGKEDTLHCCDAIITHMGQLPDLFERPGEDNTPPMNAEQRLRIEEDIVKMLKTVFDPELPVDIYSLGMVYKIDLQDDGKVNIDMTLTAPNCPAADFIFEDVRQKVESVDGVTAANVNLVFEPEWDIRMMTDEARLELGMM